MVTKGLQKRGAGTVVEAAAGGDIPAECSIEKVNHLVPCVERRLK